ncbi:MAG TPA: hypothetical protein VNI20_13710 [Fimbriimonadaceae bacterium]|nr:hypothetical protein [Fimbriimonadaceae bacterium]
MKQAVLLAMVLGIPTLALPQAVQKDVKVEIASANEWRGSLATDGMVVRPQIAFKLPVGPTITGWASLDMENRGGNEYRFTAEQGWNAVVSSGSFGITLYNRNDGRPDTTEIFATLRPFGPTGLKFAAYKDIDAVDGFYARVSTGGSLGAGAMSARAKLSWDGWIGYSDSKFGAVYYRHNGSGPADLGGRVTMSFGLANGTLEAWAQATTLLNPDYLGMNGDRSTFTIGASFGWQF